MEFENQTIEEIITSFRQLGASEDRLTRSKEVEALKSAFYKTLGNLKAAAQEAGADASAKYAEVEQTFKRMLADYKAERAEYNRNQDAQRTENLKIRNGLIEELKTLVEGPLDEVGSAFPKLRDIQQRWREVGPVPASDFRFVNDTYQFLVEKFYDMVQINHDLRDLDFKKNLEVKTDLCEQAEALAKSENVIDSFNELQKLHERWKEYGPVAKEVRDEIWERFKAATAVVNKAYQEHFESLKETYASNLSAKEALCEKVEAIVARQDISDAGLWNSLSKEIEQIQAQWKTIGFASRKENQKVYERLRAACDTFYARKKDFFAQAKTSLDANIAAFEEIIAKAAEIKTSTDWKNTTDQFISLQKQWQEVGAVPRKKAEKLWQRFRAECDYFFAQKEQNAKPENDFYGNLKAKKTLIAEIKAYAVKEGENLAQAAKAFEEKYAAIGHVPFKEKDNIAKAFREAMKEKFPMPSRQRNSSERKPLDPKAELMRRYRALQQEIVTMENNLGFFSSSKGSNPFAEQFRSKIDAAKAEIKSIEEKLRSEE